MFVTTHFILWLALILCLTTIYRGWVIPENWVAAVTITEEGQQEPLSAKQSWVLDYSNQHPEAWKGNFKALWKLWLILCNGCGAVEEWNGWLGEGNRFAFCRAMKTVSLHPSLQLSPCSVPSAVRLFLADSNQLEGSVCLICMRLFKTKKKVCISQGDGKQRKEMPFII